MKILVSLVLVTLVGCQAAPTPTVNKIATDTGSDRDTTGSTAPATRRFVAPAFAVRAIRDPSEGASVDLMLEGDTLHVRAISPRGIGGTRIEITSGTWPTKVMVHLVYAPGQAFGRLEDAGAYLEASGTKGEEPQTPLEARKLAKGGFEITVPATQKKVICIEWIDAYR